MDLLIPFVGEGLLLEDLLLLGGLDLGGGGLCFGSESFDIFEFQVHGRTVVGHGDDLDVCFVSLVEGYRSGMLKLRSSDGGAT